MPPEDVRGAVGGIARPGAEVVELGLLLPAWQAGALEAAAHRRGLTAGQLARLLIRDFLDRAAPHGPDRPG